MLIKTIQFLFFLVGIMGALSISYGAWLIYSPAGFLVIGALCMAFSYMAARTSK